MGARDMTPDMDDEVFAALETLGRALRAIGAERCADLVREHEDGLAEAMDQETDPAEPVLLDLLHTAFCAIEEWESRGDVRLLVLSEPGAGTSACFSWSPPAPGDPGLEPGRPFAVAVRGALARHLPPGIVGDTP